MVCMVFIIDDIHDIVDASIPAVHISDAYAYDVAVGVV